MVDIYNIPLFYIGFNQNDYIENHYRTHGFKNVNHFKAIDGRKMNPSDLVKQDKISIRVYDDLLSGRKEGSGMPSLGGIGCTMSHCALWQKCIDNNWPYIIICEEDNRMGARLSKKDIQKIQKTLEKPNSLFLSGNTRKRNGVILFFGLHFYIPSLSACKELVKNCYPIDIQTDSYMSNIATRGDILVEGFPISEQYGNFALSDGSSVQAPCITCLLPTNKWFYILLLCFVIFLVFLFVLYTRKFKNCRESRASCLSESV